MQVLNNEQIHQKVKRLSFQILENNLNENEIIFIGINNTGYEFAKLLNNYIHSISEIKFTLHRIILNPASPLSDEINIDIEPERLNDKTIILIDDVSNSGRTLFYACKPVLQVLPKKIETVVLVDRRHKLFPIKIDYVGLSLATTLREKIDVRISEDGGFSAHLI